MSNAIGLAGSIVTAIENEVSLAAVNWGQYITGAAPLRVFLGFIDTGDFGANSRWGRRAG